MEKKNTKSVKKEEKTPQTPQINPNNEEMSGESPKEDEFNKKEVDESQKTQGMVKCKHCKEEVEPYFDSDMNRWKCPQCNKMVSSPFVSKSETIAESPASKDRPFEILSSRNIKFSGNELAQAEMLIESGVAKNFNDLAKKAFNVLFLKEKLNKAFGTDINKMENKETNPETTTKEPDPGRALKAIQEGDLFQAQIDKLKQSGSGDNTVELMDRALKQQMLQAQIDGMRGKGNADPLSTMMMMRMMENQGSGKDVGENNFMDKMMQIQMMNAMKPQADVGLQREIADLKQQMQMQQMLSQQQQQQQGQTSSQEFMQAMEKLRAERDQSIKTAEIDAQQERDKNLQLAYDNRRIELESRLKAMEKEMKEKGGGMATERIKNMKEEIAAVKEMSVLLGDKEKGTGEMIMESLGTVAEKAGPAITEFLKAKREQPPMPHQLPQEPSQEFPQELPPEQPNPESANPSSELTPSEQQMSDLKSEMYIQKRKE